MDYVSKKNQKKISKVDKKKLEMVWVLGREMFMMQPKT